MDHRSSETFLTCSLPEVELLAIQNGRHYFNITLTITCENENNQTFFTSKSKQVRVYGRTEHAISIYTMIRNKRNEIIDWIEYHRMIGIEHFYLYDNLSEDHIDIFLKYYLDQDIVTIVKWPFRPIRNQHWN
ncbi:unnamed protein product, partial [Rotaria sp. Silwood2]